MIGLDERDLPRAVLVACENGGYSLGTAESCTGGMIGAALTAVPGASSVFNGALVTYTNAAKETLLGVEKRVLEKFGAGDIQC